MFLCQLHNGTLVSHDTLVWHIYRLVKVCDAELDLIPTVNKARPFHLRLVFVYASKLLNCDCVSLRQLYGSYHITVHLTEVTVVVLRNISDFWIIATCDTVCIFASDAHISELHGEALEDDHSLCQYLVL